MASGHQPAASDRRGKLKKKMAISLDRASAGLAEKDFAEPLAQKKTLAGKPGEYPSSAFSANLETSEPGQRANIQEAFLCMLDFSSTEPTYY